MAMELWGGVECTVNRVGDRYFEQLIRNGHEHRLDDLDRFATLGIAAIRYPILWERTAPDDLSRACWDWADRRLNRLAELGIRPILGLVHHGSGPRDTSLVAPDFAPRLAEFAGAVARRYPWASAYTPVNEPLTTARFSALYGHWYPHGKDDRTFLQALMVQCRAITLSMRAIRAENAGAQLVQTDDYGRTFSTPLLKYEADFQNHRRLLGFDLLTGRVSGDHPLWSYLVTHGVTEDDVGWFYDNRCPPDIIGLNYYLTSDRLLDERMERYPSWSHGENRRHAFADISAVHAWKDGIVGFESLLSSLWERYRIPLAITEAHVGCTREEQLRWLAEAWDGAHAAKANGADVRAVTAWSLLGAFDWNRLVTVDAGWYEPGVFDVRSTLPRPTALAAMMAALASHGRYDHPLLANRGWWRRPTRLHFPVVGPDEAPNEIPDSSAPRRAVREKHPVLIVGANGTLGRALARLCTERAIEYVALSRRDLDIADQHAVQRLVEGLRPWAVINAAGYVRVDEAEADCDRCLRENTVGAQQLATACARLGIRFLTYSSDLVFNGAQAKPYLESHPVAPLNVYGRSKAEAERLVSQAMPSSLIIRTSAFFGPWDSYNFVSNVLGDLMEGRSVRASKTVVSPTYVPDLVHASLDLMIDGEEGLWHVANQGAVSWTHLARTTATMAGLDPTLIEECHPQELGWSAERPGYSALGSERGRLLPLWEESLERYLHARRDEVARGRAACV